MDSREHWMEIEGFLNYLVSNHGRVMNRKTDRILKLQPRSNGYFKVSLCNVNEVYQCYIHRLVALTFFDSDGIGLQINHIDGDKTNNMIWNLELVTPSENIQHAHRIGLIKDRPIEIVETGDKFKSLRSCARAIDGDPGSIRYVINTGKKYKGYTFRDIDE